MSEPVARESPVRLSVPPNGIRAGEIVLRFPSVDDVDGILPAFTDPELREAGNLPAFDREGLLASIEELPVLAERGRLLALAAVDGAAARSSAAAPCTISTPSGRSSRSATSSFLTPVGAASPQPSRASSRSTRSHSGSSAWPRT
jgi:hypothetical protein